MVAFLAPALGALVGGALQKKSNAQANQLSQQQFEAMQGQNAFQFGKSLHLSKKQLFEQKKQFEKTYNLARDQEKRARFDQEKFARNSTGWAFDDLMESADQAGIHRLAALGGAQGSGYTPAGQTPSPTISGGGGPSPSGTSSTGVFADESGAYLGDAIGKAVQNMSKEAAEDRQLTKAQRLADIQLTEAQSRSLISQARNTAIGGAARTQSKPLDENIDQQNINVQFTDADGTTVTVPVGPDADEVLTGIGIKTAAQIKKHLNRGAAKKNSRPKTRPKTTYIQNKSTGSKGRNSRRNY
ncbi:hypothetical protein [Microviridae sp.]|nr:hypothetical protein [Microviridae sp.]